MGLGFSFFGFRGLRRVILDRVLIGIVLIHQLGAIGVT